MKTYICIFLVMLLLLMTACCSSGEPTPNVENMAPIETVEFTETVAPAETVTPTETEAETLPTETTQSPTEPEHSPFYLPGIPVEDVVTYFGEVCLDAEFINSGDPSLLQKWRLPIIYTLHGSYTETDLAVLNQFTAWLNTIEGFPGIWEAGAEEAVNLRIHFCDQPEMISLMGESFYGLDGAVTFWYDYNEIYDAIICCRSDINQYTRNSVLLEELYNGLGPIQDTNLRPDSIIYSGFSEPQALTEMDELILKLLYYPDLTCGMDAGECAAVIQELYY